MAELTRAEVAHLLGEGLRAEAAETVANTDPTSERRQEIRRGIELAETCLSFMPKEGDPYFGGDPWKALKWIYEAYMETEGSMSDEQDTGTDEIEVMLKARVHEPSGIHDPREGDDA